MPQNRRNGSHLPNGTQIFDDREVEFEQPKPSPSAASPRGSLALFTTKSLLLSLFVVALMFVSLEIIGDNGLISSASFFRPTRPDDYDDVDANCTVSLETSEHVRKIASDVLPSAFVRFLRFTKDVPLILIDRTTLSCAQDDKSIDCKPLTTQTVFDFGVVTKESWKCLLQLPASPLSLHSNESEIELRVDTVASSSNVRHYVMYSDTDVTFSVYRINEFDKYVTLTRSHDSNNAPAGTYAFRSFTVGICAINDQLAVYCPSDIAMFIDQFGSNRLLSCRHDIAESLKRKNPKFYEKYTLPRSAIDDMALFRDFLLRYHVRPMLFGGTLLGWYRECGLIPYTTDMDLVAWASEYSKKLEDALIFNQRFKLYWILGLPTDSLEISVYTHSHKIDLFFLYPTEDGSYAGGMYVPEKKKLRWMYPPLNETCVGDLYGYLFNVPCDVEGAVTADYGPEWDVPFHDDNFKWYSSHHNLKSGGHWTQREWRKVYRTKFG